MRRLHGRGRCRARVGFVIRGHQLEPGARRRSPISQSPGPKASLVLCTLAHMKRPLFCALPGRLNGDGYCVGIGRAAHPESASHAGRQFIMFELTKVLRDGSAAHSQRVGHSVSRNGVASKSLIDTELRFAEPAAPSPQVVGWIHHPHPGNRQTILLRLLTNRNIPPLTPTAVQTDCSGSCPCARRHGEFPSRRSICTPGL
jgi:hypothetical protein